MKLRNVLSSVTIVTSLLTGPALSQDTSITVPTQKVDQSLHAKLPAEIRNAGEMIAVNQGSFPPYTIVTDTHSLIGATGDLVIALGELLGIEIKHASVHGLPAVLTGIQSGRYQFSMGPIGDFKSREEANDFVVWVQEYVVFAVQKGNPKNINGLEDVCGNRISVMAGGSAERVINGESEKCVSRGKKAIEVQSYSDQPTSMLSVRSNRSDAFFSSQAPLTYFVSQSEGTLELAAIGKENGFFGLVQGAVFPKGSPLAEIFVEAIQVLIDNDTYGKIMARWGLENNMIKRPGINLAVR